MVRREKERKEGNNCIYILKRLVIKDLRDIKSELYLNYEINMRHREKPSRFELKLEEPRTME